jgi:hypothetical protein
VVDAAGPADRSPASAPRSTRPRRRSPIVTGLRRRRRGQSRAGTVRCGITGRSAAAGRCSCPMSLCLRVSSCSATPHGPRPRRAAYHLTPGRHRGPATPSPTLAPHPAAPTPGLNRLVGRGSRVRPVRNRRVALGSSEHGRRCSAGVAPGPRRRSHRRSRSLRRSAEGNVSTGGCGLMNGRVFSPAGRRWKDLPCVPSS